MSSAIYHIQTQELEMCVRQTELHCRRNSTIATLGNKHENILDLY
jgi:hypothetical protein